MLTPRSLYREVGSGNYGWNGYDKDGFDREGYDNYGYDRNGHNPDYIMGGKGPAGGIIFYDKGNFSNGWRYLEAAPADSEVYIERYIWIGDDPSVSEAAKYCSSLNIGGYTGWRLPDKNELNLMYQNLKRKRLGDFNDSIYISSSQYQNFRDGRQEEERLGRAYNIRAVRAFTVVPRKDGYDRAGYNEAGYDEAGYGRDGYNVAGYNREGYDRNGLDRRGFNKEGYTVNGSLYDQDGYDAEGYDRQGYDEEGYDRKGFNKEGYTVDGSLYDKDGYNRLGLKKWSPLSSYFEALYTFQVGNNETVPGFTFGIMGAYASLSINEKATEEAISEFTLGYTLNLLSARGLGLGVPLGIGFNSEQLVLETGLQLRLLNILEFRGTYRLTGFRDSSFTLSVGLCIGPK
jgi:hypothetical protein